MQVVEGQLLGNGLRFGLLAARFNHFITDRLVEGALDTLKRHGVDEKNMTLVRVPGSFELPLMAKQLARSGHFDALVALSAIIRGGTPHFEYVASECAKGLAQVSLEFDLPIGFGVLTVDSIDQAIERAGTKAGNKGSEAALSALEMAQVLREFSRGLGS